MTKQYIEIDRLVGSNGEFSAQGYSVSLSGDGQTLAVGGPVDNNSYGAVWIFIKCNDEEWIEDEKLIPAGFDSGTAGFAVALSSDGKTLAVGARLSNGTAIYTRNDCDKWIQFKYILVGTGGSGFFQGFSVALTACGDLLAVGDVTDGNGNGAVWLFKKSDSDSDSDSDWFQIGEKLVVSDEFVSLGSSVAFSDNGDILAIGGRSDNGGIGATWIFIKQNNQWIQNQKIIGSDSIDTQIQGTSVSLNGNGNILAVGGPGGNGAAWVFARTNNGQFVQLGNKLVPQGPEIFTFGESVDLSHNGKLLAVGATDPSTENLAYLTNKFLLSEINIERKPKTNTNTNKNTGKTFVFRRENNNYIQYGPPLVGSDSAENQLQGHSVSFSSSGCTLAIGGPDTSTGAGATWLFSLINIS
ncbi:MAG: hypothetical protein Harvfovirus3_4 [Harvfovirus sp.]|uniref:Uncharacterized protein n=1 Tax=Harvfovirus sp. TaxID=2487768 RepID=A0A3G5A4Z7_9VIRU|nr:MAG: hypothetical protein Harvfovirus3_4 [Harvfovirus sp.]